MCLSKFETMMTHKTNTCIVSNLVGLDNNCIIVTKTWFKWTRRLVVFPIPNHHSYLFHSLPHSSTLVVTCGFNLCFSPIEMGWILVPNSIWVTLLESNDEILHTQPMLCGYIIYTNITIGYKYGVLFTLPYFFKINIL
jgi:hypothetical protein